MSPEKLRHLQDVEPVRIIRAHLDHRQPAAYSDFWIQAFHAAHDRHLLELLDHLLDKIFIPVHHNRDARELR